MIGITQANLSILKTGKAKGLRFSTLMAICEILDCQPADLRICQRLENRKVSPSVFKEGLCEKDHFVPGNLLPSLSLRRQKGLVSEICQNYLRWRRFGGAWSAWSWADGLCPWMCGCQR